ncbi:bifunctional diaminohydroxyphosphoribosylaminopyrimidine deaminase/5-amino-6-(5-phosphoribosylamino)uracil reductase RibD, partial [bacterium]|nr:bifunctional diaminohydroxyphosphoribosylaminopyrimidine deaminase/5-amino-6-(5-phosphoribosylamino)uracil reductase RibD [bacterium]
MAFSVSDTRFMSVAHKTAQRLDGRPWPNPPVGAVVVRDGEIVGRGAHRGPGEEHAEIVALTEAGERARGATLYVTLEPCNHQGRCPPCAPAVAASGIGKLVVGVRDPNPAVAGGGLDVVREAGIEVSLGVLGRGCLELIWPFAVTDGFKRPFVILKTAATLDGRFAPAGGVDGEPFYLTGADALAEVGRLRRWSDAVLVGEGTVQADRPRLDGRRAPDDPPAPRAEPRPACVDTDLSGVAGWGRDAILAFAGDGVDRDRVRGLAASGVEVVLCRERGGRVDLQDLLDRALARGLHVLMVEGGPTLASSLLAAGLVDRWVQFVAPQVLGEGVG